MDTLQFIVLISGILLLRFLYGRKPNHMTEATDKIATLRELALAYEKYIKILGFEISDLASVAMVRGWKSHRTEQGKQLRELIQSLKKEAGIDHTENQTKS